LYQIANNVNVTCISSAILSISKFTKCQQILMTLEFPPRFHAPSARASPILASIPIFSSKINK